jgi:DNA end-binding protein Ku
MQQLLYADEVRPISEVEIPDTDVKAAELKLAKQLIDAQSSKKFDPKQYKDDVKGRIESAIQKKVEGQEITVTETLEAGAQVIDLMEALRASLEKKAPAKGKGAAESAAPARKGPKRAEPAAPAARKKVKA